VIECGVRFRVDWRWKAHGDYLSLSTAMALSPYTCVGSRQQVFSPYAALRDFLPANSGLPGWLRRREASQMLKVAVREALGDLDDPTR
jgi:hypothetical protein